jgi:hypothetical protein
LSLRTPEPPANSFNRDAAKRGEQLFLKEAGCATCHKAPNFTDVTSGPDRKVLAAASSDIFSSPFWRRRSRKPISSSS